MESFKKSFKSHGSYKHMRRLSSGGTSSRSTSHEELPILSDLPLDDDDHHRRTQAPHHPDQSDVVLKIVDGVDGNRKISREATSEGDNVARSGGSDGPARQGKGMDDPPSKLIEQFLTKQSACGGEVSLDMDLEMDELRQEARNNDSSNRHVPLVSESLANPTRSRDLKVSFDQLSGSLADPQPETPRLGRHRDKSSPISGDEEEDGHEVLICSSNASLQRRQSLLRTKTRSRLMDPPEEPERRSGRIPKSGQFRSGLISLRGDDEDDDLLLEEDLPEEYKRANFNAITLLQWVSLILIIAVLVGTLAIPALKQKSLWKLRLWKWEVMILVLICGRLVSGWGIKIIVFFIERNFFLRKKVLYFVYGVRKAVQNCLWLGLVLIAWNLLFDKKVARKRSGQSLRYVTKVLVCLLVGTLLWLVKTLIIKVLASSFHVSTYFDRIQESLFNQYVIETLSGPPLVEIQRGKDEEEKIADELWSLQNAGANLPSELRAAAFSTLKSGRVIGNGRLQRSSPLHMKSMKFSRDLSRKGNEGFSIDHLHKLNHKNVSAWNMKRLMKIVRHGVLSTLDEQVVDTAYEDESTNLIRSEHEAKAAARKIFLNVAKPGTRYITLEDLLRFMKEDEAWKVIDQFEAAAGRKRISKSSLKNWLVNVFRERRALALTLNDTKTAVNKLHHVANVIVAVIIVVFWLLILGIATSKFLLFLSSQLVLVAFIFGNTCKTIFEAIIFLFVIHPFDVGDRCEVEGIQMIVEEMNILTTVFLRYDNQKIVYPNSTLATKSIGNYYRSPDMGDGVEFCIHISTPAEKIALMKQKITSYIDCKKEHWCSSPMIIMKDLEELNRVRMAVWVCHKTNHQNMGEKWERRSLLVEEMAKIFRELDLQYRLLPLDINVREMPFVSSTRLPPAWTANGS
ncbi:mechanosensitive ion channel protein 6-like [Rhodamnia argentea]|uniref:Mechanosensitive ion channel protein n=1 Tax=Rhodamnia argentea TaxID=178133 RepID=A0ABM3GX63_9MYRT|nr:mechanosensitive ion channel protein 6-like [Rhodamnia argentea]